MACRHAPRHIKFAGNARILPRLMSPKRALVASAADVAQEAEHELRSRYDWVPVEDADVVVALGGDGFMLQTLHAMLERRSAHLPVSG